MVVWPSAWISARGWTGSLMFNVDRESDPTWNEYDLEVTYERSAGRLTLTGGYARYTYYDADSTGVTSEVVGRTDFSFGPGRVFTTHAIDVQKYRGSYYLEAGYDVGLEVGTRTAIAAEVSLAFWSLFIERYTRDTAPDLAAGPVGPLLVTVSYSASIAPALAVRTSVSSVRIFNDAARRFLDPPRLTASLAIVVGR
jgi:hypothetical protein